MFESIGVLIVFFFLIAIGLRFYGGYQMQGLEEVREKFGVYDSIKIGIRLSSMPELKCSIINIQQGACIDIYKVQAFGEISSSPAVQAYYTGEFGNSLVILEQMLPQNKKQNITIYNLTDPTKGSRYTPYPVSLYDPVDLSYGFGVLHIWHYQ